MSNRFTKRALSTVIAASLMAEAIPAMAQLEEIIVTSRKRDETVLQVPATTAVLSEQMIDRFAISDVTGVADKTPGLNFSDGPLSSGVLVSMRGIGTGSTNPAMDQSVALAVDGMQLTQGIAFGAAMFDLAQVEVLKGPQALFFGKAAPAGVISVRSADPGEELEVILKAGYEFEGEEKVGELIVSGPLTDTLGLRLAAQFSDMEGYLKNEVTLGSFGPFGSLGAAPVTEENFPNKESLVLRGTAVWDPTDSLNVRFKLNYSEVETSGSGSTVQLVSCPEGTGPSTGGIPVSWIGGNDCQADDTYHFSYMDPTAFAGIKNGGVPFSEMEQMFGSLELTYDLGNDLSLNSVTGFYEVIQDSMVNGSATSQFGTPFALQGTLERRDITQELRLTSDFDSPINFLAGIFYQKGLTQYGSELPFNQALLSLSTSFAPYIPALANVDHDLDAETVSVFGQLLWQISDDLELGLGARWTNEDRAHSAYDNLGGPGSAGVGPVDILVPQIGSSRLSPELSVTYTPTYDLTIYGNLKQAWKSGSFDVGGGILPTDDKSFDDERVQGAEIGAKTRMLDGNLAVNVSTYYYQYDDMQVEARVFNPLANKFGTRTVNAATANVYGIDFDLSYAPSAVEGLTLYSAVNWNKGEYDEFDNAQCWPNQTISQGCSIDTSSPSDGIGDNQDLSGQPLLRAPDWMVSVGFDYDTPINDDLALRIGTNTAYSSSYSASASDYQAAYQGDYAKTSVNIGLIGADERWKLEVIGNNITDEVTFGNCALGPFSDTVIMGQGLLTTGDTTAGPSGYPEAGCYTDRGRSVLVRWTMSLL